MEPKPGSSQKTEVWATQDVVTRTHTRTKLGLRLMTVHDNQIRIREGLAKIPVRLVCRIIVEGERGFTIGKLQNDQSRWSPIPLQYFEITAPHAVHTTVLSNESGYVLDVLSVAFWIANRDIGYEKRSTTRHGVHLLFATLLSLTGQVSTSSLITTR